MLFLGQQFFDLMLPEAYANMLPSTDTNTFFREYALLSQEIGVRFWESPDPKIRESVHDFEDFILPISTYFVPAWGHTILLPSFKYQGASPEFRFHGKALETIISLLQHHLWAKPLIEKLELDPRVLFVSSLLSEQRTALVENRSQRDQELEDTRIQSLLEKFAFTPGHMVQTLSSLTERTQNLIFKNLATNEIVCNRSLKESSEWGVIIHHPSNPHFIGYLSFPEVQIKGEEKYTVQVYLLAVHADTLLHTETCRTLQEAEEALHLFFKDKQLSDFPAAIRIMLPKVCNIDNNKVVKFVENQNLFIEVLKNSNQFRATMADYSHDDSYDAQTFLSLLVNALAEDSNP